MQKVECEVDFNSSILSAPASQTFALNFNATWVEQCSQMNLVFETLAGTSKNIRFLAIDADEFPAITQFYQISSVPAFLIIRNRKVVDSLSGANAQALVSLIEKNDVVAAEPNTSPQSLSAAPRRDLDKVLRDLVVSNPMMIFIKGTPAEPRCKFSRELIDILKSIDAGYGSFNILGDDEVRQGLKTLSEWPTFPQVYINGEFVGGLDIVRELVSLGEFALMVPKEDNLHTKLGKLVNSFPVLVFIKGTRTIPKCGFSRQIVQILKEQNIEFETYDAFASNDRFDILEDEDVRQGMKEFSKWPTFPQLYVKGEFVGGLDIIKEMIQLGDKIA